VLSLARPPYTAAQVDAALHALTGQRHLAYQYDLYSSAMVWKKTLTTVLPGGSVDYSADADIKRTCRFTLEEDPAIQWGSDRIKISCLLTMPDGGKAVFPLGVFLPSTPTRKSTVAGHITRDVAGYDLAQILTDDLVGSRYTVTAGTLYTTAIATLLSGAGITAINLTPSASTLPVSRDWDPGTAKLAIVSDLLTALNYDVLQFDADGNAVVKPYVSPQLRAPDYTYQTDAASVILPGATHTFDLFAVPNTFILVVSQPDRNPALSSTYTNVNPASPTSTASRGRTITSFQTNADAVDQATLNALVARQAFEASQVYEPISLQTLVMPMHAHLDTIQLIHAPLGISALYSETGWSLPLSAGGSMSHSLQRVVSV
jgi:hypothetical protein